MNTLKFSERLGSLRLFAIPIAVLLFFLVMSTSTFADIINVSATIGNQATGSGSVTPGLPSFLIQDAAGPGVCGSCSPGTHSGGTNFFLDLFDTTLRFTHQGQLNFHGPATWDQPVDDPTSPLAIIFPVTFDGSFGLLGGPLTALVGTGTGSIQLGLPIAGDGRMYLGSTYTVTVTAVPEPGTALLLVTGVAVLLWPKRRTASTT
ncbi:MAG: PEP-CTERM sorting domain-containing protein [Nitrospirota bacterium]